MIYKKKKRKQILENTLFSKTPLMFGIVNALMAIGFLLLYFNNLSAFETQEEIVWNFGTILFTLFTIYFYILALPISIGELMIIHKLKKDNLVNEGYYYTSTILNIVAVITLFVLTLLIFG